jgi:hypothetical protein
MTDEIIVPDSIQPIIARRCWGLGRLDGRLRLVSGYDHTIWPAKQALVAQCTKGHEPPHEKCTCGIYALAQGFPYYDYGGNGYAVFGEINLWGRVIEGERGYRAQYAYPKQLFLAHGDWRFLKELKHEYGVPVALANPFHNKIGR